MKDFWQTVSPFNCTPIAFKNVYIGHEPPAWFPSQRPELTGDRFPLPINTGRVDGHAFPLAELTGRQFG